MPGGDQKLPSEAAAEYQRLIELTAADHRERLRQFQQREQIQYLEGGVLPRATAGPDLRPAGQSSTRLDPDKITFAASVREKLQYDAENGDLLEMIEDRVTAVTHIRARLREQALRAVLIIELEKLGYTVISPEV